MKSRIFLLSILLIFLLHFSGLFNTINNTIYDNYVILNQQKTESPDIVILGIDSKSIKEIGYWPWPRSIFADIIKKVVEARPAVIGVNLSFTETQGKPDEDKALYEVLKSYSNIVIATKFKYKTLDKLTLMVPEKSLFPNIKHGHTLLGEKDFIRSFPPAKVVPAFALVISELYLETKGLNNFKLTNELGKYVQSETKEKYSISEMVLIDFKRSPKYYKRVSVIDLLEGKVPDKVLENKIVMIGIIDKYITPYYATPFSRDKNIFSSTFIELQTQIVDSLLDFRALKQTPIWLNYFLAIIIAVFFFFLTKNKTFIFQGVSFIALLLVICVGDFILFKYAAYWFPPAILLSLIFMIFAFHIYFTITQVDSQLFEALHNLDEDKSIPLKTLPSNISHKIDALKSLMKIIVTDRKTIKAIINGVNNSIIVFNNTGNISWSNKRFREILSVESLENQNLINIIPNIDLELIIKEIKSQGIYKEEFIVSKYVFLCIVSPIEDDEEQYVAIFNDITELKEIDRLKTDMMRMVSHELKTPLTNIMIASENISDIEERKYVLENNDIIFTSVEFMSNTIKDFLDLNKLESNLMQAKIIDSDIIKTLNDCIETQNSVAQVKNITIKLEDNGIKFAMFDPKLLLIVLNNLISNAIKYSHNDSEVIIRLEEENCAIKVSVIDFGLGIAEDEIEMVIDKFYRATNNEQLDIKGSGLGLSIVTKILSLHDSEISIISKENEGSTFLFKLSACKQAVNS